MIIAGRDKDVADWASNKIGCAKFQEPFTAYGFTGADGEIVAAAVLNDFYPNANIEWSHVGLLRCDMLKFLARFVFNELQATRVTAKTRRGNVLVRRLLPKGGFQFEGVQRRYFGPTKNDDALVFCMFREHAARWLT